MAAIKGWATGLALVAATAGWGRAAGPVELREAGREGETTQVKIELSAKGQFLPAAPPGATREQAPRPLPLKVEVRLGFVERRLKADGGAARRVVRAASAVNVGDRPLTATVRPEVATLVAEPRPEGVLVFSPDGPLTRPELELLEVPGDPLTLASLLPDRPVEVGDRWTVGEPAARSLSSYDRLTANTLEATLESVDGDSAKVRLLGELHGSRLGGEGSIACHGWYTFDRKAGRVDRLTLERAETRRPGVVEDGLDVKSTLTVSRGAGEPPAELSDDALARLATDAGPARERLLFLSPDGKYSMLHDRGWHLYWDSQKLTVLKRVEGDRAVADCRLTPGPAAGKGRHQDPGQFRDDVRKTLGARFVQFLGAGEVEGDPAGGFRYKVGVQGRQDEVGVIWYYYLIAGPEGDQVLATFTLAEAQHKAFGDRDEVLIGTLRWAPR